MNGLGIADARIREKELLTADIYLCLILKAAATAHILKQMGFDVSLFNERRFQIKTHIAAEKAAERILTNRKSGLK